MFITACEKKHSDNNITNNQPFVSHLDTKGIEAYLPQEILKRESFVVYKKEEDGTEKHLRIYPNNGVFEGSYNGKEYTSDVFQIRLIDESNINFLLEINGSALYNDKGEIEKSLIALLMPGNQTGSSGVSLTFEENEPISGIYERYEKSIVLLGKTFLDVYTGGSSLTGYEKFSEISINSNEGIVSFRDIENKLWVFDRFED